MPWSRPIEIGMSKPPHVFFKAVGAPDLDRVRNCSILTRLW